MQSFLQMINVSYNGKPERTSLEKNMTSSFFFITPLIYIFIEYPKDIEVVPHPTIIPEHARGRMTTLLLSVHQRWGFCLRPDVLLGFCLHVNLKEGLICLHVHLFIHSFDKYASCLSYARCCSRRFVIAIYKKQKTKKKVGVGRTFLLELTILRAENKQ